MGLNDLLHLDSILCRWYILGYGRGLRIDDQSYEHGGRIITLSGNSVLLLQIRICWEGQVRGQSFVTFSAPTSSFDPSTIRGSESGRSGSSVRAFVFRIKCVDVEI